MKFEIKVGDAREHSADAVVMFSYDDLELRYGLAQIALDERFKGKLFEAKVVKPPAGFKAKHVILAGLGKREKAGDYSLYGAAGRAAQAADGREMKSVAFMLPETVGTKMQKPVRSLCEGVLYALYSFDEFKTKKDDDEKKHKLELVELLASSESDVPALKKELDAAQIIIGATNFTRELVNCPSNLKKPPELAERIRKRLSGDGVHCRVLDEKAIRHNGMNALLGVAGGSAAPPRLVLLEYGKKGPGKPTICLVGKGVTFDSGGISLKPSKGMDEMKDDMAGAAAVAGALSAIARLKLGVHIVGILPLVENMPSGTAQRPGDIVRAMNGKTIEVLNTDAEGRMVLADALAYAEKNYKPTYMIDIATLTGAIVVALGKHATGLLGNDEKLLRTIMDAGEAVHERCWQLPLWDEYRDMVKGKYADVKNVASDSGEGSSITASAFLENFVGEGTKWAHLDIAGTAMGDVSKPFERSGASGVGVRLFVELVKRL